MSKSLLKSRFWQILLYCKAFSPCCGKWQAASGSCHLAVRCMP